MAISKVVLHDDSGTDRTLVDLTGDTVAPETLMEGATAHDKAGNSIVGTAKPWGGDPQVQSDWAENDPQSPAYVKNRPFYTKDPVESVFAPEQTVTLASPDEPGLISTTSAEIKLLTKYQVTINGNVYEEVSYYHQDIGGNVIGKGTPPTVDPFIIFDAEGQVFIFSNKYSGDITVSVVEIYEEPVKLPEKYLPEKILKTVGKATADGEVFNDYTENIASAYHSHAEGTKTTASGNYGSHAEGRETTASGDSSHAEGLKTTASGNYGSHAEGRETTASGDSSHAEGLKTTASGNSSHAEGLKTTASGGDSHAEGLRTTASGDRSHAEGLETIASGECSHVEGMRNIPDTSDGTREGAPSNKYAHIVGNGKYDYDTGEVVNSNAHTLDWDGNSWYQGNVLVGGKDMDAPNAGLLPDGVVIKSSTPDSAKFFKITVTDDGGIKATEFTWPTV